MPADGGSRRRSRSPVREISRRDHYDRRTESNPARRASPSSIGKGERFEATTAHVSEPARDVHTSRSAPAYSNDKESPVNDRDHKRKRLPRTEARPSSSEADSESDGSDLSTTDSSSSEEERQRKRKKAKKRHSRDKKKPRKEKKKHKRKPKKKKKKKKSGDGGPVQLSKVISFFMLGCLHSPVPYVLRSLRSSSTMGRTIVALMATCLGA